jgi:hypothetical protein
VCTPVVAQAAIEKVKRERQLHLKTNHSSGKLVFHIRLFSPCFNDLFYLPENAAKNLDSSEGCSCF